MASFFIPILFWIVIVFIISMSSVARQRNAGRRRTVSSDGHTVPPSEDLTCERYGHDHSESTEFGRRYIVHEEPEDGYVILNGVKRKISECKYL